jgi:hypothetical protein
MVVEFHVEEDQEEGAHETVAPGDGGPTYGSALAYATANGKTKPNNQPNPS